MPAENGRDDAGVIGRLLADPQRFSFFQAVRLALRCFGEQGMAADDALGRGVRFRNSVSFAFPPSEIEGLERDGGQIVITPAFIGLLGAHGALPVHVSERLVAWEDTQRDDGARAFLDLLTNRMVALFYQAWRKYRVEETAGSPDDGYKPLLLALAGCPVTQGPGAVPDDAVAWYAGLLQHRPLSSIVLGQVLCGYLGAGVAVEETVDFWDDMAPDEQTSLGQANAALGDNAVAGARAWRPDLRVRLTVGPLDKEQYEAFLPDRHAARALADLLRLIAEPTLIYEIVLILQRKEVQPCALRGGQGRLGLDCFLGAGAAATDRSDMRYELRPLAHLTFPR